MTTRRIRFAVVGSLSGLILSSGMGCGKAVLSVEDAVMIGGRPTAIRAHVERPLGLGFRSGVQEREVRFSAGDQQLGECNTCDQGSAQTRCDLPDENCDQFTATVTVDGKQIRTTGQVFKWDADRTIIAVDVDETLSVTDYLDLMCTPHDGGSRPISGSVQVMNELARDYHIAYVTSRPRFMLERTRCWLRENGYPAGPVIVAASWSEWRSQTGYKRKTLSNLRRQWPNLLIGIGDKQVDVDAYSDNRMLTLIVNEKDRDQYGSKAITLRDWATLRKYFTDNRALFSNPTVLASRIDIHGKLTAPPRDAVTQRMPPGAQQPQVLSKPSPGSQRERRPG